MSVLVSPKNRHRFRSRETRTNKPDSLHKESQKAGRVECREKFQEQMLSFYLFTEVKHLIVRNSFSYPPLKPPVVTGSTDASSILTSENENE